MQQVGGEQHGSATRGEVTQQAAHPAHTDWVKPVGGLVEDEQLGIAEERVGDPETLTHTERVLGNALAGRVCVQVNELEHLIHARLRDPEQLRGDGERLAAAAALMHGRGVDEHPDMASGVGDLGVGTAEHRRAAGRRMGQPAEQLQCRGFAGPIRPQEPGDRARGAGERDVLHGRAVAIAFGEGSGCDHGVFRLVVNPCQRAKRARIGRTMRRSAGGGEVMTVS